MSTHRCPRRGCQRIVPDRLYACRDDWFALSRTARARIWATAHLPVMDPERREVFRLTEQEWNRDPGELQREAVDP